MTSSVEVRRQPESNLVILKVVEVPSKQTNRTAWAEHLEGAQHLNKSVRENRETYVQKSSLKIESY